MKKIELAIMDLKTQLDGFEYPPTSKDFDKKYQLDASDLGNLIGISFGSISQLYKNKKGWEKDDLFRGIEHGISLMDGTHDNGKITIKLGKDGKYRKL